MNIDPTVRKKLIIISLVFIGLVLFMIITAFAVTTRDELPTEVTKLPDRTITNDTTADSTINGNQKIYNIEALRGESLSTIQTNHLKDSLDIFIKNESLGYIKIVSDSVSKTTNKSNGVIKLVFTITTDTKATYDVTAQYVGTVNLFVSVYKPGTTSVVYIDPYDSHD